MNGRAVSWSCAGIYSCWWGTDVSRPLSGDLSLPHLFLAHALIPRIRKGRQKCWAFFNIRLFFFGKLFKSSKKHPTMQAMQGPPWLLRFRSSTVFIIATVWISSFTVRLITKPLEDLLIIAQWQDYFLYAMVRVPCPVTTNSADVLGCPHPANSTIRAGGCSI